jgi:hypothetical protein
MTTQNSTPLHPVAPRLLYDRKESARQLSVSVRTLDYIIASKKLDTRRIGKKVLVPHAELVRYARGNHPEPVDPSIPSPLT